MADGIGTDSISILNRILDSLTYIKVALECLSKATKSLKAHLQDYELQFDAAGRFRGLVPKTSEPAVCIMPPHDFCIVAESNCKYIPQYVDALWTAHAQAESAINELPETLHDIVSKLAGRPWRPMVRRELLNSVTVWPGDSLTYHAIGSQKIPIHMPTFLDYLADQDPLPQWEKYQCRVAEFTADILALSGELGVQLAEEETSMPADNPAAVHLANARQAWEDGFAIVAHRVNDFARQNGLSLIDIDRPRPDLGLGDCYERLIGSLQNLNALRPDLFGGEFNVGKVTFWIVDPSPGLIPVTNQDDVDATVKLWAQHDIWEESSWQSEVVKLLHNHAEKLRTWFDSLADAITKQKRHLDSDHNSGDEKMTPSQKDIVQVVKETGNRLSTHQIFDELCEKGLNPSFGMLKQNLAELSRRGILPNRRDTKPPGYGLPDWT